MKFARIVRNTIFSSFVYAVVLLGLSASAAYGQYTTFGRNKPKYFPCAVERLSGPSVDYYFCPEAERTARYLALPATEKNVRELSEIFGVSLRRRGQFHFYPGRNQFKGTNLYPGLIPDGLQGFTETESAIDPAGGEDRLGFPFEGDYFLFAHVTRHEMVHRFQIEIAQKNKVALMAPNGAQLFPLWWIEGQAEYLSAGQEATDNMQLTDLALHDRLPSYAEFHATYGYIVYPLGGAFHAYLANRFGPTKAIALYATMRSQKNFARAFKSTYGIAVDRAYAGFMQDFKRRAFQDFTNYASLVTDSSVTSIDDDPNPAFFAKPLARWNVRTNSRKEFRRDAAGDPVWDSEGMPIVDTTTTKTDSVLVLTYFSPKNRREAIYESEFRKDSTGAYEPRKERRLLEGEGDTDLESLYSFESRMSVCGNGQIAFVSKRHGKDIINILNTAAQKIVSQLEFDDIYSIRSPTCDASGNRVAFTGSDGAGVFDLYVMNQESGVRSRLTNDIYYERDPAWSPNDSLIAFASDGTQLGDQGAINLFTISPTTVERVQLTRGKQRDGSPTWSPDGKYIAFVSDRDARPGLYAVSLQDRGTARLIVVATGLVDPTFLDDSTLIFIGYENQAMRPYAKRVHLEQLVYAAAPSDSSTLWRWSGSEEQKAADDAPIVPYLPRYNLKFGVGQASVGERGSTTSFQLFANDLQNDRYKVLTVMPTFDTRSLSRGVTLLGVLNSINTDFCSVDISKRTNTASCLYGHQGYYFSPGFRQRFKINEAGAAKYWTRVNSQFSRLELGSQVKLSDYQERVVIAIDYIHGQVYDSLAYQRRGVIGGTSARYVFDNTLWGFLGPVSGRRMSISANVNANTSTQGVEETTITADLRYYKRLGDYSNYALQAFGHSSTGKIPDRLWLGYGQEIMRLYDFYGFYGAHLWTIKQEIRMPVIYGTLLALGPTWLPPIEGALFFDAGQFNAMDVLWLENKPGEMFFSAGASFRMPLFGPFSLRYNTGKRWSSDGTLPSQRRKMFSLGINF